MGEVFAFVSGEDGFLLRSGFALLGHPILCYGSPGGSPIHPSPTHRHLFTHVVQGCPGLFRKSGVPSCFLCLGYLKPALSGMVWWCTLRKPISANSSNHTGL